ncbi:aminopeptidase P family protein [Vacuolonema iberomarrocanum]|uniref:aminopeptidase P family protein n=1 Tax=Vacuolonema iberomarrocanum TaxID=3454632 RepID=UPI0019FEC7D6|nr:aminopeptidase P family protein [filamentous cyanobacterium LEGE 07170]
MPASDSIPSLQTTLLHRRQRLADLVGCPVVLWSGGRSPRNFPANTYPFRASSHFLYFAGLSLDHAAIRLDNGRMELFMDDPTPADILWHGAMPTRDEIAQQIGAEAAYPLEQLTHRVVGAATVAVQDTGTRYAQAQALRRGLFPTKRPEGLDRELALALVELRLCHDASALAEMRRAIAITVEAHLAGMAATRTATQESEVRAAIEAVMIRRGATPAYTSIVTTRGEVLHSDRSCNRLQPGDLMLVDAGAETESGWASDVTRTYPVSGTFSPTQRDLYDVVLAAHDRCIDYVHSGAEYRTLHWRAALTMADGLAQLGILKGDPESLVEQDAHALFFPHGIGHLLGLDVHDMEDFGDLAGYAPGRVRSDRFGLCYLRLDRPLQAGMVVTIEPGFYQVDALLNDPERRANFDGVVNWERLEEFRDVRGIRIEDDVLVTETGSEVLTVALPTDADSVAQCVRGE